MIENYNLFDISTPKQWKTIGSKYLKEDGEYPVYGANGIIGYYDKYNHEEETVFIGCRGTCGSVHLSEPYSYINGNAMAFDNVDNSKISNKYLFYFFKQYNFDNVITGTAIPQITKTSLQNVTIPIPDLPAQNKIVAILDKASDLIQQREESINLLDELLRAQFLKMFGDPVLNPKDWEFESLSSIGNFQSGGTPSKKNEKYWGGDFPWVSPKDMKRELIYDSLDHISESVFTETSLKKISKHNILIVVRGMILAHSFPVALNTRKIAINQDMKAIELKNSYNPFFILVCLIIMKDWILKFVSTAGHGTKKISSESLDSLKIVSPPIKLQNQFETIYHNIQAQKETLTHSKTELENLYNSLLQRTFSGQLNFNIDIELDALLATIDIEQDTDKEKHDIKEITTVYAGRLLERIEEQKFENQTQYQQAKQVVFQMLEEGIVEQAYDDKTKAVKLKLA